MYVYGLFRYTLHFLLLFIIVQLYCNSLTAKQSMSPSLAMYGSALVKTPSNDFSYLTLLSVAHYFILFLPSLKFELIKIFQLKYFAGSSAPNVHTHRNTYILYYLDVSVLILNVAGLQSDYIGTQK